MIFVLIIGLSYIFMLELGISGVGYAWLVGNGVGCMCVGAMVWREGWQVDKRWVVAKDYLKHKIIRTIMILILSRKDYTFPYQG